MQEDLRDALAGFNTRLIFGRKKKEKIVSHEKSLVDTGSHWLMCHAVYQRADQSIPRPHSQRSVGDCMHRPLMVVTIKRNVVFLFS